MSNYAALFKCWPQHVCISAYVLIVWLLSRNSSFACINLKKERKKSVHLICMKASHWPLEKGDKVDISLRVMISVCICLHMCVCLRHISELYDKTHQHVTTRWNGGRRGRTDGGRDWKKMNDTRGRFYFSLSQWGPLGKVVRHNANMSVWIARWEEDSCLRWQRWLLMLNLSASPQTYSYTHTRTMTTMS